MSAPFVLFGPSHLMVLAVAFALPLLLAVLARLSARIDPVVRTAFALWLIGVWIVWFWLIFDRHWQSAQTILPMHLCDWACIAVIITMLMPNQRTYELAYFWALAGTLQRFFQRAVVVRDERHHHLGPMVRPMAGQYIHLRPV